MRSSPFYRPQPAKTSCRRSYACKCSNLNKSSFQNHIQSLSEQVAKVVLPTAVFLVAGLPSGFVSVGEGVHSACAAQAEEVMQVASFLGIGPSDPTNDNESYDPFTLQGQTEKQYSIAELQGNKVIKRRRGVTSTTCIKIASAFQPGSGKLEAPQKSVCRSAEDASDIKSVCQKSCQTACKDSLEEYRVSTGLESGLPPSKQSLERPQKLCTRSCSYECQKEGSGYRFTVNSNR